MIAPRAGLSVSRQCELLGIARSSFYYRPRPEAAEELDLLQRLDRIFTDHPVYGSRRLQVVLAREGTAVGRRRVRRLMKKLGLCAVRPKRNSSKPAPGHKVYPYLLRELVVDRPNQVWASDITYIPMQQGFLYLVAIIDWATRRVLAWRLSNTLTATFCIDALREALAKSGRPEIFNSDQGAQFTSDDFTQVLGDHGVRISMDGRGRCHDNIFVATPSERRRRDLRERARTLEESLREEIVTNLPQFEGAVDAIVTRFRGKAGSDIAGPQNEAERIREAASAHRIVVQSIAEVGTARIERVELLMTPSK